MRRCFLLLTLVSLVTASPLQAATGRVLKVLPFFLDKKELHTLSPSLYERDAYQAQLRKHPELRTGLLYRVEYDEWLYLDNIGGLEAGVWLWQTPDHMEKLGASVQYQAARRAEDNITRRRASADGVIKFQWRTPERYFLYLDYHHDIGDASNGGGVNLLLSRNFIFRQALFDHDCMLVPAIGAQWVSAKRVDYYWGVRPEEATSNQPAYAGRETFIETARLTGFYIINRSWNAFAGVQASIYGPGITDSPIVTRHSTSRGYLGAAWVF